MYPCVFDANCVGETVTETLVLERPFDIVIILLCCKIVLNQCIVHSLFNRGLVHLYGCFLLFSFISVHMFCILTGMLSPSFK